MSKDGERGYLDKLGEAGRNHALNKPFSDVNCGFYLADLGNLMKLLPSAPARVLDLGVGTGWTSCFIALAGYDVVGVDIAANMIECAEANKKRYNAERAEFLVSDFENLAFQGEFDAALFFESLHHAVDEEQALASVYRALKPGGCLVCLETEVGHAETEASRRAIELYCVTEKDMPPSRIVETGKRVGFSRHECLEHVHRPKRIGPVDGFGAWLEQYWRHFMRLLFLRARMREELKRRNWVVLWK